MLDTKKFRPDTVFQERKNGDNDKIWLIAADFGYSGVKIMSPTRIAWFPSYASRISVDRGFIGELPSTHIVYTNLENGEKWIVGKSAQDEISDRNTSITEKALFGRERYDDPMFHVIVEAGLAAGMMSGEYGNPAGKEIYVQTGYPPAYEADTDDLRDVIAGNHHFSLKIGNLPEQVFQFTILPENVYAMPQPMGSLFSVTVTMDGKRIPEMRNVMKSSCMVFDAGFGTLDLFPIKNGRLEDCQTNDNLGMKRVLKETASLLRKKHGIDVSVPALQKYLDTGKARYHRKNISRDIPFSDLLESASSRVCEEAVAWMTQMYGLYEYDYLIVTGGTSAAWMSYIKDAMKDMSTLKIVEGTNGDTLPPVFSNVRGYFLYRQAAIKVKAKS